MLNNGRNSVVYVSCDNINSETFGQHCHLMLLKCEKHRINIRMTLTHEKMPKNLAPLKTNVVSTETYN